MIICGYLCVTQQMLASLLLTFSPDGIVAHGDAEFKVDHGVALVVDAPCNLTHLLPSVTAAVRILLG